ncbi:MAG: diacylglycerol kinase family protein [Chloroflexota bacterium]
MRSFTYAWDGIVTLLQTQPNARVHALLGIAAAGLALAFGLSALECAILAVTMGLVLVAEAVNTAIEAAVDLASPGIHPTARLSKDVAAGAVLLSAVTAVVVGLLLFGPRIAAMIVR